MGGITRKISNMTARSHDRGHEIEWDGTRWVYSDSYMLSDGQRTCIRCGQGPTKKGYDLCLGYVPGAISACCGHGIESPYRIIANKSINADG